MQNNNKSHKGLEFQMLYDKATIQNMVDQIANRINHHYSQLKQEQGTVDLVVVCVLKGAFMFYSDLVKLIHHEHTNQFIRVKSYAGTQSQGELTLQMPIKPEHYTGKHILIVEDIYDSGNTLKKLITLFQEFKPKSVEVAVLFKRPDKNKGIDLKFCGLDCEDFIIGYGLDFDEYGRSFPEIYQKVETK